ncbi:MAG: sodium/solute symporter [Deltaproteobacteria bacterium]|nr:sodium/solute symporter [Deltaproteobacteria bacterium]MBW1815972.1 sodium/solute symporter [Deltaproteobacteria bacterium]
MTGLDWLIIVCYLIVMVALSVYVGRGHSTQTDYFVGGRRLPWWAVGLSTMATQTSAISFISIPAFVALRPGGGLTWLQYEMAVPLAMIAVMVLLLPFFRRLHLISVYGYLERRFNPSVRYLVSGVFLVARSLGTGVGVYASGIVLSVCLGIPLWSTILIMGSVTVIYDTIGGISAVVYSDVVQTAILIAGIIMCIYYASGLAGGLDQIWTAFPHDRRIAIDPSAGIGEGGGAPLWAFLIGGFFLYVYYYGTDQSQVQRELSSKDVTDTKLSLMFNGFARFPLTLLYVAMGVMLWGVVQHSPELGSNIPEGNPDYLVPSFIRLYLPPGLRALVLASLLAASMSSLDSALNSLSACTMRDYIGRRLKDPARLLLFSKLTTIAWGVIITLFAFAVGHISSTVVEGINMIGSLFAGPILGTFVMGVLSTRVTGRGVMAGILIGVALNLGLALAAPSVHWMWWNMTGFLAVAVVALLTRRPSASPRNAEVAPFVLQLKTLAATERPWLPVYGLMAGYFVLILAVLISLK